jgi:putative secretion ATPase (PEP-CTERM system associated)
MYEKYYGFTSKPFQLKPDPRFFYGSKGHKRAMSYLEYGISQGEGFIVITGEIGAGKTTLMRNLFSELESKNIVAAQIVNTHVDADDILRLVAGAFGIDYENTSKATMLHRIEQFLRLVDKEGKRALLVVDEAQNLSPRALEELRMLSNFQTNDKCLLQTFLLGQPEFRQIMHSPGMQQLYQRIIANYHLGPLDVVETRDYIEHRLSTVGWKNDPKINREAFIAIHNFTGGIPRKINAFCDRMFLMGYLDEIRNFTATEIALVIQDIQQDLSAAHPPDPLKVSRPVVNHLPENYSCSDAVEERLGRVERALTSIIETLNKMIHPSKVS